MGKKTQFLKATETKGGKAPEKSKHEKMKTTKVTVKYDVGFNNAIYIRGEGGDLSWKKGKALKNTGSDIWVWETDKPFNVLEFKVLINDERYESGENHRLEGGGNIQYTPSF